MLSIRGNSPILIWRFPHTFALLPHLVCIQQILYLAFPTVPPFSGVFVHTADSGTTSLRCSELIVLELLPEASHSLCMGAGQLTSRLAANQWIVYIAGHCIACENDTALIIGSSRKSRANSIRGLLPNTLLPYLSYQVFQRRCCPAGYRALVATA